MRYATATTVPVAQSRAEIESMLMKYGASHFNSGWGPDCSMVSFCIKDIHVRFVLPLPLRDDPKFCSKMVKCGHRNVKVEFTENQKEKAYDQEIRSRWRALALVVKAKLEAVECGISTVEKEFLAFIVLPGTEFTVGDWMEENAMPSLRSGIMPRQLGPAQTEPQKPRIVRTEETA